MNKALGFGVVILLSALPAWGQCPSADSTRDCFVDLADFAILAGHWLTEDPGKEAQDFALLASQWLTGDHGIPQDMVWITGGTFQMGNSKEVDEGYSAEVPVHTVTLDSFAMCKYEVTNGQYLAFLKSAYPSQLVRHSEYIYGKGDTHASYRYCTLGSCQINYLNNSFVIVNKTGQDMTNYPMFSVTWYGAVAYCNWRSQQEGREQCYNLSTWTCDFTKKGYRLPTEAEWEYAARGGLSGQRFPWGDTITHSQANYFSDSSYSYDISPTRGYHPIWNDGIIIYFPSGGLYTAPVGSFPPNSYGLYDMAGNVWEWCHDVWNYYSPDPQTNPTGPAVDGYPVQRGGSWLYTARECRVSPRRGLGRSFQTNDVGFRVVLNP